MMYWFVLALYRHSYPIIIISYMIPHFCTFVNSFCKISTSFVWFCFVLIQRTRKETTQNNITLDRGIAPKFISLKVLHKKRCVQLCVQTDVCGGAPAGEYGARYSVAWNLNF